LLPRRCGSSAIKAQYHDFKVKWLTDAGTAASPTYRTDYNISDDDLAGSTTYNSNSGVGKMCYLGANPTKCGDATKAGVTQCGKNNYMTSSCCNLPSSAGRIDYCTASNSATSTNTGIGMDGGAIGSYLSGEYTDPVYPMVNGAYYSASVEGFDASYSHPNPDYVLHYHAPSGFLAGYQATQNLGTSGSKGYSSQTCALNCVTNSKGVTGIASYGGYVTTTALTGVTSSTCTGYGCSYSASKWTSGACTCSSSTTCTKAGGTWTSSACYFNTYCAKACSTSTDMSQNANNFVPASFTAAGATRTTFIGIAYDGRPIYGPFDSDGKIFSAVDICNGAYDQDGNYVYVAQLTWPYLVGCWGPVKFTGTTGKTSGCSANSRSFKNHGDMSYSASPFNSCYHSTIQNSVYKKTGNSCSSYSSSIVSVAGTAVTSRLLVPQPAVDEVKRRALFQLAQVLGINARRFIVNKAENSATSGLSLSVAIRPDFGNFTDLPSCSSLGTTNELQGKSITAMGDACKPGAATQNLTLCWSDQEAKCGLMKLNGKKAFIDCMMTMRPPLCHDNEPTAEEVYLAIANNKTASNPILLALKRGDGKQARNPTRPPGLPQSISHSEHEALMALRSSSGLLADGDDVFSGVTSISANQGVFDGNGDVSSTDDSSLASGSASNVPDVNLPQISGAALAAASAAALLASALFALVAMF